MVKSDLLLRRRCLNLNTLTSWHCEKYVPASAYSFMLLGLYHLVDGMPNMRKISHSTCLLWISEVVVQPERQTSVWQKWHQYFLFDDKKKNRKVICKLCGGRFITLICLNYRKKTCFVDCSFDVCGDIILMKNWIEDISKSVLTPWKGVCVNITRSF